MRKRARKNSLPERMRNRVRAADEGVFLREDFRDLGGYDQVGRGLKRLVDDGDLVRLGYGVYVRAEYNEFSGRTMPYLPVPDLVAPIMRRLGVRWGPSWWTRELQAERSTQVPARPAIRVLPGGRRITRRIGYGATEIAYETRDNPRR